MSQAPIETVLRALEDRQPIDLPVAVVVAHPDDETIGAGASLALFRRLLLIHVTDGAPRNLHDAHAAGFETCAQYAAARERELEAALTTGGVQAWRDGLGVADQSASLQLDTLPARLARLLRGSAVVLTHAYEGGHPDHDAVAFAVQASGTPTIEMAGYHAAPDGGLAVGAFAPGGTVPLTVELNQGERATRDAMLRCFGTQAATLAPFMGARTEQFRPAPAYDFTRPPTERVYYDGFDWGMTSARWCGLAAAARPAAC